MWIKQFLVFILLLVSSLVESKDYRFAHLTSVNGLSQSEVYSFLEDRNGFMWIGTVDGLNRYDGYSFEVFNTNIKNPHSLSNNTVRCLAEDKYGRIWIGTDNGLNFYDQNKELIYKVNIDTSFQRVSIWSLLVYEDYILVGTSAGLWKGTTKDGTLEEIEKSFHRINKFSVNVLSNSLVRRLLPFKNGEVIVITDSNISKISFKPDQIEPVSIEEISNNEIKGMIDAEVDSIGNMWILSIKNGIYIYKDHKKSIEKLNQNHPFLKDFSNKYRTLSIDRNQQIWVGTADNGLLCINYDFEKNAIRTTESIKYEPDNEAGLNSNHINSTYVSGLNKLWIGTIGSGVNILDPEVRKLQHYKIKTQSNQNSNSNFIRAVMVDEQNRILAGAQNNGLYLIDRATKQSKKIGFDTETVFYISHYRDNLYFVCYSNGIALLELNGSSLKILSSCVGSDFTSFYVVKCRNNNYWIATLHGIVRFSVKNNKIVVDKRIDRTTKPSLSENNCRVLYFDDANNQLIVGTEGRGLNYIQLDNEGLPVSKRVYEIADGHQPISNNYIRSIYKDKNNDFWVGTFEGLNKVTYNTSTGERTFKTYTKDDGLPNNMIEFIVEDDNNCLWLGTNGGLSKFSPQQEKFINYHMADGLQSNEFSEHTVFKTNSGEFVMGGINGINTLFPEDFKISSIKPLPLITDFYLNNEKVMPGKKVDKYIPLEKSTLLTSHIDLAPNHRNIGFKFSAMVYPNAGKVKYAYMLEGFDTDWKYTNSTRREIYYTNLKHGHYTFKVKATNTDGIWNDMPTTISIKIKTPFYQSIIAFLVYLIILILIIIYFSHYTVINLTTKRNLFLEKEHSEKIIKLDEMRTRFFTNISHDLRTPLTLISEPLKDVMTDKNTSDKLLNNLQLIKRNVKRLSDLVEQLLDFRKAEESSLTTKFEALDFISFSKNEISYFDYAATKKGLAITFNSSEEIIHISIDPKMIAKVYFNIISNALKYTNNGEIIINIRRVTKKLQPSDSKITNNSYVQVEVSDTGIGISKDQEKQIFDRFYQGSQQNGSGYGIGLSHAKDLIAAHKGEIEAESNPQGGTIVRFFIPDIIVENTTTTVYANDVDDFKHNEEITAEYDLIINPSFKNILVVEDNIDILNYLKNKLSQSYNVTISINGAEGQKMAKEIMPDLIISDVMMPVMDGIEFCKVIKTDILTSHIPVILLTAKADLETKYKGIETGADDYIPKPFEMEYLLLRINNLLQSRENLKKIFQRNMVLEPSEIKVNSLDENFLNKTMEIIEANISDENFSITTLETMTGMSHTTFYRKLKSLTGQTAQELLTNYRLKRAHQILIENKGHNVSDVAFMVGFSSLNYFSKCFREFYGCTPSELKNKMGN